LLVGLVRANHGRPNAVGYLWTGVACFAILMLAGMAWLLNEVDPQRMKSFGAVSTRKSVPGVIVAPTAVLRPRRWIWTNLPPTLAKGVP